MEIFFFNLGHLNDGQGNIYTTAVLNLTFFFLSLDFFLFLVEFSEFFFFC